MYFYSERRFICILRTIDVIDVMLAAGAVAAMQAIIVVFQAPKDHKDRLVIQALRGHRVLKGRRVLRDHRGLKGLKGQWDHRALKDR